MSPLWLALALSAVPAAPALRLEVPIVKRSPERCGPAALAMVMRFYGADSSANRSIAPRWKRRGAIRGRAEAA